MALEATRLLSTRAGTYAGDGIWHDEASESKRYRIDMRIDVLPDGRIQQWFKHLFFEENDTVVEQTLVFENLANGIFTFSMGPLACRGYSSGDALHYTIPIPGNTVDVTYFFTADGKARVVGSSQKNKFGRYIWWEEHLRLVG
jgi:hypothetical protein